MNTDKPLDIYFYPAETLKDEFGNELPQSQIKIAPELLDTFLTGRFNLSSVQVDVLRSLRELRGKQFFSPTAEEEPAIKRAPFPTASVETNKRVRLPDDRMAAGTVFNPRLRRTIEPPESVEHVPMPKKNVKFDASALEEYISPAEMEKKNL